MTIAREEIFGPVLVVIPYDGDDDAVRIANDSDYGLAGYVLSESLERSTRRRPPSAAGSIGLNGTAAYGAEVPFGGYKASGIGRQNGVAGFEQYLEVKSVRRRRAEHGSRGGGGSSPAQEVQGAVEDGLCQFVDDGVSRRLPAAEERRPERRHGGDHGRRRVGREVGIGGGHAAEVHPRADAAEDGQGLLDVGDAGLGQLLLAQPRQRPTGSRRGHGDRRAGRTARRRTAGRGPPRRCARGRATATVVEGVHERGERHDERFSNSAAFEPKWRKSRCSATPAASAISRVVVLR